ncbi:MAG: hypothetical protein M1365_10535, partial [Actinobacteria bacterium]|nr:hypothetical protein [Actinomycetota bacterium]
INKGITIPVTYDSETISAWKSVGEREVSVTAANKTGAQQADVSPDINPKPNTLTVLIFLLSGADT